MPYSRVSCVDAQGLCVIEADDISGPIFHDADPEVGIPNSIQRNQQVGDGYEEVVCTSLATKAVQHHRLHSSIIVACHRAQPELLASLEHAPICPEDEDSQEDSDRCEVGKPSNPCFVVVRQPDKTHDAQDNTDTAKNVSKPIGPRRIASNQNAGILGDKARDRTRGEEK